MQKLAPGTSILPDITLLLPSWLRADCENNTLTRQVLISKMRSLDGIEIDGELRDTNSFYLRLVLGDIVVSGIPCIDWSTMGLQAGVSGPSFVVVLAWGRALRAAKPKVAIIEEAVQFPEALVADLVGDLCAIDSVILCASFFRWPIRRRRKYMILTLKSAVRLSRKLADLKAVFSLPWPSTPAAKLLCYEQEMNKLSEGRQRILQEYVGRGLHPRGFCDLSQRRCNDNTNDVWFRIASTP